MWGILGSTIPNLPIHSQARRGKQHQRRRWASGQDETTGIEEFGNVVVKRTECHGPLGLGGFEEKRRSPCQDFTRCEVRGFKIRFGAAV